MQTFPKLFISYARVDKATIVDDIVAMLSKAYGKDNIWLDERIEKGDKWWEIIKSEIEKCDIFMYLLSDNSIASTWCSKEFQYAEQCKKDILTVIVRHCSHIPEQIDKYNHVDLLNSTKDVKSVVGLFSAVIRKSHRILDEKFSNMLEAREINSSHTQHDEEALEQRIEELVAQAGNTTSNYLAKKAINQLRELKRLEGENGVLKGRKFKEVDWHGVNLSGVNLTETDLSNANLQDANLHKSNMDGTTLEFAMMQGADMTCASLENANLFRAELQKTLFINANLLGARLVLSNLHEADLSGANLLNVEFSDQLYGIAVLDQATVLPNETNYHPKDRIKQLERFTDPDHPNFWRSDNPESPAHIDQRGE